MKAFSVHNMLLSEDQLQLASDAEQDALALQRVCTVL